MESRKIQKSGTTYYLYLPAAWCREHKITTDSVVFLEKSSKGDLVIEPKKTEANLTSLKLELNDSNLEVINKVIIAVYINPVKEFQIILKENLNPDQILEHKKLLGGMEMVDFEEGSISCKTSLSLSDPDALLDTMIRKILSITKLIRKDPKHELIQRYEEEIDKSNLLIYKAIISSLMYRKESKLRHIDLFYMGMISRSLEQITDILITEGIGAKLIDTIESMMDSLLKIINTRKQIGVINFIKSVDRLKNIEVKDIHSYKEKRIYSLLGYIAEILCDWMITDSVDKTA